MRPVKALFVLLILQAEAFIPGADGPVTNLAALEGGNATLFCDTTPETSDDELMLLVWYKNQAPLYSFDGRVASEWSNSFFNYSSRLTADLSKQPTELHIVGLTREDEGLYHCRVDFSLSQTRNLGVDLSIIVLPSLPFFLDELSNKVEHRIGPFHDGDTLVVTCLVIGGIPSPKIRWYSGDLLVDDSDGDSDIPGVKENTLYLPLNRDHSKTLTCEANNTELSKPVSNSLEIYLFLPPNKVTIHWLSSNGSKSIPANKAAIVSCHVEGSHPPAEISWWLDHNHLSQHSNQTYNNATGETTSFLEFIPYFGDNGATLSCVATNVAMAPSRGSKADVAVLNVTYLPVVEIMRVDEAHSDQVLELDPLKLKCDAIANPEVDDITWYFNDSIIVPNSIWGKDTSSKVLYVEESSILHTGFYACSARNSIGRSKSDAFNITVLYPPKCKTNGIQLEYQALFCNVQALPIPDTYFWHISINGLEPQHLTTGSSQLQLNLINGPLSDRIKVSCEASNGVSSQDQPCEGTFTFEHLRPQQPKQCDLDYNRDEFLIQCIPVQNASLYSVSVWRQSSASSLVLSRVVRLPPSGPLLRGGLGGMGEGDEAQAEACNRFGCSQPLMLRPTETLLRLSYPPWWQFLLERDVGIAVGSVVLVTAFILSTCFVIRLARRPRSKMPTPIVQVLQLDDVTREYIDQALERKHHASCSGRSCSSGYSGGSLELDAPPVERYRKPFLDHHRLPPDVTLTLHRESAV